MESTTQHTSLVGQGNILVHPSSPMHGNSENGVHNGNVGVAKITVPSVPPPPSSLAKPVILKGEPFIQTLPCFEVDQNQALRYCRECDKGDNAKVCRFIGFRRLTLRNPKLQIVGFPDPNTHPTQEDLAAWNLWKGEKQDFKSYFLCRRILSLIGSQFCRLVNEEKTVEQLFHEQSRKGRGASLHRPRYWKRVDGVRETCDVCQTTLFNYHYICAICGFSVCIDCQMEKRASSAKRLNSTDTWVECYSRNHSDFLDLLLFTQIIPGNSMQQVNDGYHQIRSEKLPDLQPCACLPKQTSRTPKSTARDDKKVGLKKRRSADAEPVSSPDLEKNRIKTKVDDNDFEEPLKVVCKRTNKSTWVVDSKQDEIVNNPNSCDINEQGDESHCTITTDEGNLITNNLTPCHKNEQDDDSTNKNATNNTNVWPNDFSEWLCNGRLLRLKYPTENYLTRQAFQCEWQNGKPVVISGVHHRLNPSLWAPETFSSELGEELTDLVNCKTGETIPNQPMKLFWDGFNDVAARPLDKAGQPLLLKLKDWPPGDDFQSVLPQRFSDLMDALPLPDYTSRSGYLNLVSWLPKCIVRPDLGPKMYTAYGSATYPEIGTTNLHLDVSDAVNVLVYVGLPKVDTEACKQEALETVNHAGCDNITNKRAKEDGELPGALWHIYAAKDSDKIRHFLKRVATVNGLVLGPHDDPIHDQNWYLDKDLRNQLYSEYGVKGYTIVQFLGDAVFIPAGAPHQVLNLHNCIKVAEDFVSPENIDHCLKLAKEFRRLSDSHHNHEDKLQIKNIIYHSVKSAVSILSASDKL